MMFREGLVCVGGVCLPLTPGRLGVGLRSTWPELNEVIEREDVGDVGLQLSPWGDTEHVGRGFFLGPESHSSWPGSHTQGLGASLMVHCPAQESSAT